MMLQTGSNISKAKNVTRLNLTTQEGVSGVASMSAKTASAPIRQPKILSKAEGAPPLWIWGESKPRNGANLNMPQHCHPCVLFQLVHNNLGFQRSTVIQCWSKSTFLTASAVIGLPSLSIAPSDTMMMFNLCEKEQNKDDISRLWIIYLACLSLSTQFGTQHLWPVGLRGPLKIPLHLRLKYWHTSGTNTKSASVTTPATSARYPQCLPIT